jgi:hypothetical protein
MPPVPTRTRSRSTTLVASTLALLLAVTACSTDGDADDPVERDPLEQIRDATQVGGSARYEGTVTFTDGTSGPLVGVTGVDPTRGEVTFPVSTTTGVQQAGVTWTGDDVYILRAGVPDVEPGQVFVRAEADAPWARLPAGDLSDVLVGAYDPFTLLDRLVTVGDPARLDGTEVVDGRTLDRYVVEPATPAVAPAASNRIELLVDGELRLAAVRLSGGQPIEYGVTDYGTAVEVSAPPEDQIFTGVAGPPSEDPAGPYEQLVQGTFEGITWQLVGAPATNGGTCWRLDANQGGIDPVAGTEADGATCLAAVDPAAPADEQVLVVADSGADATFDALAVVLPAGSQARMRFLDRTSEDIPVDPRGFLVWVGPKQPLAVVLDVTTPDGSRVACGPGPVSSLDDLENLLPDQLAQLDRLAWLCLPGD